MWRMEFAGGEELARVLNKLPSAVAQRSVLLKALRAGAEPMRSTAEQLAPRRTGRLAENIIVQTVTRIGSPQGGKWRSTDGEAWVAVGPRKEYFYGLFQEYGTKRHSARPFMRPAFMSGAPAALPIISAELWRALRKEIPTSFAFTPASGGRLGMAA
jgi:HK97 gp10 family phage protein